MSCVTERSDTVLTPDAVWVLVEEAQRGDSDAFAQLYERYVDLVYGFILSRTQHRATSEELTSETFVRALVGLNTIRHRNSTFRAWIMTIARNLIFDYTRSAQKQRETLVAENCDSAINDADPLYWMCNLEAREMVWHGLNHLTKDQRRCVVLRFFEDLSVAEVAYRMERSGNSVRALQLRALRRLKAVLLQDTQQVQGSSEPHRRYGRGPLVGMYEPLGCGRAPTARSYPCT